MKSVLRGKFIVLNSCIKSIKSEHVNDLTYIKALEKEQVTTKNRKRKEIIKIRAETKETIQKIDKTKCWFLGKNKQNW